MYVSMYIWIPVDMNVLEKKREKKSLSSLSLRKGQRTNHEERLPLKEALEQLGGALRESENTIRCI